MTIQAAIVDDEPLARARLLRLLQAQSVNVVAQGETGLDAVNIVQNESVDVLFIDINMPLMNGLEAVEKIAAISQDKPDMRMPAIVFCTAYDEYAVKAFQTNAIAYLLKPFGAEDVSAALTKATQVNRLQLTQLSQSNEAAATLVIHHGGVLQNMDVTRCAYFKSVDKHVYVVTESEQEILVNQTLAELEKKFHTSFVRIHRNALLNRKFAGRLLRNDKGHVQVELKGGGTTLAVSRRHLADIKSCFES